MAVEIERKFLVANDDWRNAATTPRYLRQGYLALTERAVVRVRLAEGGDAWIGIKERRIGRSRGEFEYPIPVEDARELLALCMGTVIEKRRFRITVDGHEWEVDEFAGANEGLVLAEVELSDENETFVMPPWLGREVTAEERFYNAALSLRPWQRWSAAERQ